MITVYGMPTCPDCAVVEKQIKGNPEFVYVDIGAHIRNLKEFLRLRDNRPEFAEGKAKGYACVPCFVREDGSITLDPKEVGLCSREEMNVGSACRLDGTGC